MAKKTYSINMEFLGMSRKKLQPGDIFVYKNKYKGYGWGRVINTDVKLLDYEGKISMRGFLLIYIYNVFTDNIKNIPELKKGNLLVPPDIINRRGWIDSLRLYSINRLPLVTYCDSIVLRIRLEITSVITMTTEIG